MSVLLKDLGNGIKSVIINDPKTYNSLSFKTLGSLIKIFKNLLLKIVLLILFCFEESFANFV